jgi:hypothetical protein
MCPWVPVPDVTNCMLQFKKNFQLDTHCCSHHGMTLASYSREQNLCTYRLIRQLEIHHTLPLAQLFHQKVKVQETFLNALWNSSIQIRHISFRENEPGYLSQYRDYGLEDQDSIPGKSNDGIFSLCDRVQTDLKHTQPSIQWVLRALIPGAKCEADHSSPITAEIKMCGAIPPLPQYVFIAWCLANHRDQFTPTLITVLHLCHWTVDRISCHLYWGRHSAADPS